MTFDMEATFGDDYLYFYEESIDDAHSDSDTAEILGLLDLPSGARILDAPCGHGRIARRLAAAGMEVTGVDLTPAYLDHARNDPQLPPGTVTYLEGDVRSLPVDGPFDAVVCWLNSFGYYDDADCHRVLDEFHRVLRPGGKVAIDTMHHDGGVRHFIPAPDAVVVQLGDDTMVEVSTFDPVRGRMVIRRTVHRDGAVRRAVVFHPFAHTAGVGGLAGGRWVPRRRVPLGRRGAAGARQLGARGGGHGLNVGVSEVGWRAKADTAVSQRRREDPGRTVGRQSRCQAEPLPTI